MDKKEKIQKKLCTILVISIIILFSVLTIKSEAVNVMNNTTNNTRKNTSNIDSANLSNLGINPHDFSGFKPEDTYYEVTVPESTKVINVYAKAQYANAKLTGTGKKNLQIGENKLEVQVKAQNGNEKTYTINVIRGKKEEATNSNSEEGLSELKINNLQLSPEFKTGVYEYNVKYIGEDTKLNIETKATNENYIVEVTGNENLKEGENLITILVSENSGDNVATYQVIVNKDFIDEEAVAKEEGKRKQMRKITIGVIGAIIILTIMIIYIRYRKKEKKIGEMSRAYFYGSDNYREENEEDEIPKSLKKNKKEEDMEIPKALRKKDNENDDKNSL